MHSRLRLELLPGHRELCRQAAPLGIGAAQGFVRLCPLAVVLGGLPLELRDAGFVLGAQLGDLALALDFSLCADISRLLAGQPVGF